MEAMRKHFSETTGHQRLIYGAAVGVVVALSPLPIATQSKGLLAWSAGALIYLVLAWWLAFEFDAPRTRERAQSQDQPGLTLFAMLLLSVFASIAAITLMLQHVKDLSTEQRLAHLSLAMVALGLSWLLMQTIFAFRYAHLYYQTELYGKEGRGGLDFPGKLAPDYFDFLYYAHVVGMTSQVSDVVVTSRQMRHLTLVHSVTAFAFNMLVLALSINVMAGAIQYA
jgi:uncharacterized membrane protein